MTGRFHRDVPARVLRALRGPHASTIASWTTRAQSIPGHTLTVDHMGNVVGPILYNEHPRRADREITASVLASGRAVWFGADCSQQSDRASGPAWAVDGSLRLDTCSA